MRRRMPPPRRKERANMLTILAGLIVALLPGGALLPAVRGDLRLLLAASPAAIPGVPGPSATGVSVNPRELSPAPHVGTGPQPRPGPDQAHPRLYPVDAATFGRMK